MESCNDGSEDKNAEPPKIPSSSPPSKNHHRRVQSDEQLGGSDYNYSSAEYGIPPAPFPTQISYASPNYSGSMNTPSADNHSQVTYDSHSRSQSWALGGNGLQYPPYPTIGFPPPQAMQYPAQQAPNGSPRYVANPANPYTPTMIDAAQMAAFQQQMDPNLAMRYPNPQSFFPQPGQQPPLPQTPQPPRSKHRGHKRAHSYSGAPTYGSMDPPSGPVSAKGHRRRGSSSSQRDFSPRNEIMGLAGRRPSIGSSSGGGGSYHAPPSPSSMRGPFPLPANDLRTAFSGSSDGFGNGTASSNGGGEAIYIAKKHKGRSPRKMHMRQRSAQLFMENVKGQEQIPPVVISCS